MTDDMDARARVKRLEAENTELRFRVSAAAFRFREIGMPSHADQLESAVATPPPENEPHDRVEAAYWEGRSDERKLWEPHDAHPTPEQTATNPPIPKHSELLQLAEDALRGHWSDADCRNLRAAIREFVLSEDEQTGDALAAYEVVHTKARHCTPPGGEDDRVLTQADSAVRRHLTASGVPKDRVPHKCPTCGSPSPERHPAVQFEGEVIPCRDPWHQHHPAELGQQTAESALRSLASWLGVGGYNADRVDPATFEAKIREGVETAIRVEKQRASGVPYVPEEVRRLSDVYREKGRQAAAFHTDYNTGRAHMAFSIADRIEVALASAPADGGESHD